MKASIFWFTGMSGSGKTTLANAVLDKLKYDGINTLILDGDVIRDSYDIKLGFSETDIEKNNLLISEYCYAERLNYDCIIVPIISPFDIVRKKVKSFLSEKFYLIYLYSTIDALRLRDPKGLYRKADLGELNNLIGYSDELRYDVPSEFDLIINTSKIADKSRAIDTLYEFIKQEILDPGRM